MIKETFENPVYIPNYFEIGHQGWLVINANYNRQEAMQILNKVIKNNRLRKVFESYFAPFLGSDGVYVYLPAVSKTKGAIKIWGIEILSEEEKLCINK